MDRAEATPVRPAQAVDAPALAALCQAHAAFEQLPYQADGHASRLAHALENARLHAWVVERDGDIVGYASATLDFSTLCGRGARRLGKQRYTLPLVPATDPSDAPAGVLAREALLAEYPALVESTQPRHQCRAR